MAAVNEPGMTTTNPGIAVVYRRMDDGTRGVWCADPFIRVATSLLESELEPDVIEPDGTLRLDTAGKHRYRFLRAETDHVHIYERIQSEDAV